MRKKKKFAFVTVSVFIFLLGMGYYTFTRGNPNLEKSVGDVVDEFNGVKVYFNGGVGNVVNRNTSADGYNLGLKYQCVEFVKRYFYERYQHKMPDSYGHAKSFYNTQLKSGAMNKSRGMYQFANGSKIKPKEDDLIVFDGTLINSYGHVAIISEVTDTDIEITQQNPGPFGKSRIRLPLINNSDDTWKIDQGDVLGFLRMPSNMQ